MFTTNWQLFQESAFSLYLLVDENFSIFYWFRDQSSEMAKVLSEGQTLNLLKLHSESLYFQFFTKADGEKF